MKKLISLLLVLVMVAAMVAGCNNASTNETKAPETKGPASALEILETIWGSFAEDEKFYVMGGDMNNMVENAPGKFDIQDTDGLSYTLLVPAEQIANIDDAASLVHGMMTNNFTCGAFHVTGDVAAFVEAMKTSVMGNQWMCGMPEKLIVAVIGEYVVMAYGVNDAINPFETKLTAAYPSVELKVSQAITG